MGRAIGGVIAAFVLWTVLWLGFNQIAAVALPEIIATGQPLTLPNRYTSPKCVVKRLK